MTDEGGETRLGASQDGESRVRTGRRRVRDGAATAMNSPLVGRDPRITLVAIGYVVVFTAMVAVAVALDRAMGPTSIPVGWYDRLRAWIIIIGMTLSLAVPIVYALLNDGALFALALAVWPEVLVPIVSGQFVLTPDLAIALTVGATAAAVGTLVPVARSGENRSTGAFEDGLLVATGATVLAAVAMWRLTGSAAHPFGDVGATLLSTFVVPLFLIGVGWLVWYWNVGGSGALSANQ